MESIRFRLRSEAVRPRFGEDERFGPREAWAVPMGLVTRNGREHLAVATTRCVIDYRYPTLQAREGWANLALFTRAGRPQQVFRIASPRALAGQDVYDQRERAWVYTNRLHLEGEAGDRYFGELAAHPEWGAEAVLPVGDWNTTEGVDIAILYFPLEDPGTRALRPRPAENRLEVDDPEAALRDALQGRTSFWGDTFRFSLVSDACMAEMQDEVRGLEASVRSRDQLLGFFAAIAGVGLLGPALPSLLSGEVMQLITARGQQVLGGELSAIVWRTISRSLAGERLEDIVWDEGQSLVMSFARDSGVQRVVLAGIMGEGLSPEGHEAVRQTVSGFLGPQASDARLSLLSRERPASEVCDGSSACVGSILSGASLMDVGSELLVRGLVRLDTRDQTVLAQQPGLVEAARDAITDPATRSSPAIADPTYQQAVMEIARALL